jgi:DNA (cytosine-5)-methyltransferase 1
MNARSQQALLLADARRLPLANDAVDLVVTSPPYWRKRDYGVPGQIGQEPTPADYVAALMDCLTEWRRVLTPSGSVFLNVGDGSTYRWWLKQFDLLGYRHRVLYLNSMFFGVPQSRDRLYIAFWDKSLPTPDLDHRPVSRCPHCDKDVEAVWTWKTGIPESGTVMYGKQYEYRCPSCRRPVVPPMTPSLAALDLTDLGTRIGDRKKPLAPATMARAERCRQRFAEFPAVLMPAKAVHGSARHLLQPLNTQTSQQETSILSTGAVIAAHRHNGDGQHITRPMDTVTSTHEKAILLAVDNYQGGPRGAGHPLPTQVGSETLAVVSSGIVPYRKNTLPTMHGEVMPTVTSDQIPGLLTAAGTIKNNGAIDEARYRAHPVSDPLGTLVGSAASQALLFSGWYKENGKTAPHPMTDPLGTVTAHDTTALLMAEWRAALSDLPLEECFFRMMAAHEVGRGCGFDVDFPGYSGSFVVWGSARNQVDGFGNAVSPQVGAWIGSRLRAALDRHAEPQPTATGAVAA